MFIFTISVIALLAFMIGVNRLIDHLFGGGGDSDNSGSGGNLPLDPDEPISPTEGPAGPEALDNIVDTEDVISDDLKVPVKH